jgi:hypothetical protein
VSPEGRNRGARANAPGAGAAPPAQEAPTGAITVPGRRGGVDVGASVLAPKGRDNGARGNAPGVNGVASHPGSPDGAKYPPPFGA